jgi:hypothetical protein
VFKNLSIITYIAVFLVLAVLLKLVGLINSSFTELGSYALIFYGVSTVYISMGKNKRNLLFVGTAAFLIGVELFITSNYDFLRVSHLVLPSIFFVLGAAFLILFFDDFTNKLLLIVSLIFLISAAYFFSRLGTFNFSDFIKSSLNISLKYWPVFIIIAALILLLNKEKNK